MDEITPIMALTNAWVPKNVLYALTDDNKVPVFYRNKGRSIMMAKYDLDYVTEKYPKYAKKLHD